jgi:hypothetical protein
MFPAVYPVVAEVLVIRRGKRLTMWIQELKPIPQIPFVSKQLLEAVWLNPFPLTQTSEREPLR